MTKQAVSSKQAPEAIGPYSQAVRSGNLLFCSGQIPLDPGGQLVEGDIRTQTCQVFDNLAAVLQAAGADTGNIVKLTIYLMDLGDFAEVNQVMRERFVEPYPARATVAVAGLPLGVRVEVEAIAVLDD